MSLPPGSRWAIHRESVSDQTIEITGNQNESFTAKYVGIENPSKFSGEVWTRQATVINIKQHTGAPTNYVAFHSGLRQGTTDQYKGTWYDNAGQTGAFSLTKQ